VRVDCTEEKIPSRRGNRRGPRESEERFLVCFGRNDKFAAMLTNDKFAAMLTNDKFVAMLTNDKFAVVLTAGQI
jgi:hypothetical protein